MENETAAGVGKRQRQAEVPPEINSRGLDKVDIHPPIKMVRSTTKMQAVRRCKRADSMTESRFQKRHHQSFRRSFGGMSQSVRGMHCCLPAGRQQYKSKESLHIERITLNRLPIIVTCLFGPGMPQTGRDEIEKLRIDHAASNRTNRNCPDL